MSLSFSRSASLLRLSIIIVAAAAIERAAVIAIVVFLSQKWVAGGHFSIRVPVLPRCKQGRV